MALKIPDAPNVNGTQPVLRNIDSVNPQFEKPNFKIDISQPAKALQDVGKAYADYVDYNTNIWMGAACNQFSHDMIEAEAKLKNTHKGLAANDLYAKLEKKATALLTDITGEPKDDDRVRIANPELKRRFRDWASKQMPAYQSRMMNYSASELDAANKEIIRQGIEDNNNFILGSSYETAGQELNAAWPNFIRAAQLSAPGMPRDYQMAEAARMMDEAVYAKVKILSDNNIPEALQWYYNVPEVQRSLSSRSQAAFFDNVAKHYVEQGGSWAAGELASGASGLKEGGYLDPDVLRAAFPGKSEAELGAISTNVFGKAREINDARMKAQQGMLEHQLSAVQGRIIATDYSDPDAVMATYQEYYNADPRAADAWMASAQKKMAKDKAIDDFNKMFPNGDPRTDNAAYQELDEVDKTYIKNFNERFTNENDVIPMNAVLDTMDKSDQEKYKARMNKIRNFLTANVEGLEPKTGVVFTAEQLEVLDKYDKANNEISAWVNSPVYTEYAIKAASGEYHGEHVPELEGMPAELRNNLGQIAYYNDRYNEVVRLNPHIDDDLQARIKDYKKKSDMYRSNIKREAVKEFDRYRQQGYSFPVRDSTEYETILNRVAKNAESPSEARTNQYLVGNAPEYLQTQKINAYLDPAGAIEALDDVDALPIATKVAQEIDKGTDAEDWADAIIDATPRTIRHRIEPYREAIQRSIEETGNADVWYQYIDGIGQK